MTIIGRRLCAELLAGTVAALLSSAPLSAAEKETAMDVLPRPHVVKGGEKMCLIARADTIVTLGVQGAAFDKSALLREATRGLAL